MNTATAKSLRVGICRLTDPITFEQMDGSLLGGKPVTHVTEPISLEIGTHKERIRFRVVPKITEEVVLGLAWLDKWDPTIWWGGGCRHIQIGVGPDPPPHEHQNQGSPNTPSSSKPINELIGLLEIYKDLEEVRSERECDTLPLHHAIDCTI